MKRKITSAIGALALAVGAAVTAGASVASADTVINGCTVVSEPSPTRYTNCPGVSFAGANLDRFDFTNANLEGADFTGATSLRLLRLWDANLKGANFESLDLRQVYWVGADATGAKFAGANLSGTSYLPRLTKADLTGANLSKVGSIWGAFFDDAILRDASFNQSNLTMSSFKGADLRNAKFNFADMSGVQFSSATKLTGTDLSDTILDRVDFSNTAVMPKNIAATADSSGSALVAWSDPAEVVGAVLADCTPPSGSRVSGSGYVFCKVQSVSSLGLPLTPGSGHFYVSVTSAPDPTGPGNGGNPENPDNPGNGGGSGSLGSLSSGSAGSLGS